MHGIKTPDSILGPANAITNPEPPLSESILIRSLFAQEHTFGNGPIIFLSEKGDQWIIDACTIMDGG